MNCVGKNEILWGSNFRSTSSRYYWVLEFKPKQEFENEVDYYFTLVNLRPDSISIELKDDVLDNYTSTGLAIFKISRMKLREEIQDNLDDPYGFLIILQIDYANRVIRVEHSTYANRYYYSP
jgi:hypothetical protein